MSIRLQADSGKPTVVADPDGEVAAIYKKVARDVAVKIARSGWAAGRKTVSNIAGQLISCFATTMRPPCWQKAPAL